jgi:signal transduction histidine kinase
LKLKVQILTLFILTSIAIVIVTGYLYYDQVQNILVEQNINELKAVSKAKSARVNFIIQSRITELEILRRSPLIKSALYNYLFEEVDSNGVNKIALYNAIIRSKEAMEGINRLMILDSLGNILISSSPSRTLTENYFNNTSPFPFLGQSKVTIDYRYNEHEELVLCLAAYIDSEHILLIENDVNNILSVTEDYTGLGTSGESAIFRIDEEGNVVYLTPLRFYKKPFLKEVKNTESFLFQQDIKKGAVVYTNRLDYRNKKVTASINSINKTDWKVMTKMDTSETLIYMERLRKMAIIASVSITLAVSVLIYLFAYFFVKPINDLADAAEEISQGDLTKRVEIKSKNELGQLAASFNKMTNSLVATQKDLQSKLTELNRSNSALDKFAHVVSHDIKTPINSIEGLANLLQLELRGKVNSEQMELILKIQDLSAKTKGMVKGILEVAGLKAQLGTLELVDLNEVVDNIRSTLTIPAHIKLITTERLPIMAIEKISAYQIFQNLISNAVKYNDKAEGIINIDYTAINKVHKFSISDNGRGIDKEFHSKIFEIFNTGKISKDYDSTGIGLSIVKSLVEEKGGTIWIESTKGEGTTFHFNLPDNQA